jgi:hypothetical protein
MKAFHRPSSDFRHRLSTRLLLAYSVLSFVVMSHASFAWGGVAGRNVTAQ